MINYLIIKYICNKLFYHYILNKQVFSNGRILSDLYFLKEAIKILFPQIGTKVPR